MSIFLGGYFTAVDSGNYEARDASNELLSALKRPVEFGQTRYSQAVLDKRNIVFICHSTGGIVTRYLLYHDRELFNDKTVGLVLIASPSYGSRTADTLGLLTNLYNQEMGRHLRWADPFLKELDYNFRDLVNRRLIPHLDRYGERNGNSVLVVRHL